MHAWHYAHDFVKYLHLIQFVVRMRVHRGLRDKKLGYS